MTLVCPLPPVYSAIFRRLRISFTMLSLVFALFTIFIILSCNDRPSRKYTRLLLTMLILTLISDVYVQLVMAPLYFYPVPCLVRDNPLINIPGRASVHYVIWLTTFISSGPFFIGCFFHRHQIVMAPDSRFRFSEHAQKFPILLLILILLFVPRSTYNMIRPPGAIDDYRALLSPDWSEDVLNRADCYYPDRFHSAAIVGAMGNTFVFVVILVIASHTFATLRKHSSMSERTRQYHHIMTKSLVLQSGVPIIFTYIPLSVNDFVYFQKLDGSLIIPICFTFLSAHSFFHSLVVVITTPVYRRRLVSILRREKVPSMVKPSTVSHPWTSE